jgi:hypothetical protein
MLFPTSRPTTLPAAAPTPAPITVPVVEPVVLPISPPATAPVVEPTRAPVSLPFQSAQEIITSKKTAQNKKIAQKTIFLERIFKSSFEMRRNIIH